MSESKEETSEEKSSKLETCDRIVRLVKNLVLFWILLSVTTGGFSCAGKDLKLEYCNPNAGIVFDKEYSF